VPYNSLKDLPSRFDKYSETARRQWMYVFNTTYESTNDEGRAFAAANSVFKKRFSGKSKEQQSENENFNAQIDTWLGNLNG